MGCFLQSLRLFMCILTPSVALVNWWFIITKEMQNGDPTAIIEDSNNHYADALRYAIEPLHP